MANEQLEPNVDTSLNQDVSQDAAQSAPSEHYVSQSQVNDIVKAARSKAYERARDETDQKWSTRFDEHKAEIERLMGDKARKSSEPGDARKPSQSVDADAIERAVSAAVAKQQAADQQRYATEQNQQMWTTTINQLTPKIEDAARKYDDFHEMTTAVNYHEVAPEVLLLANQVDNSGDILYHLAANPAKLAMLKSVIRETPHLAQRELTKLSTSLKQNDEANSYRLPRDPLSQLDPTHASGNSGEPTVTELRQRYRR
jgi:hypothetical protein